MAIESLPEHFSETGFNSRGTDPDHTSEPYLYNFETRFDITLEKAIRNYDYLTFPSIRQQAVNHTISPESPLIIILAQYQGQAVGMVIVQVREKDRIASLRSICVLPEHRRRGVGSNLLDYLEKVLVRQGYYHLEFIYQTNWSNHPVVAPVLENRGWTVEPHQLFLRITREQLAKAPVLQQYPLPEEFTVFPWPELTRQERQTIQERQKSEGWYPPELDPFQYEPFIEPYSSIGLRYEGQVIGWKIHHRFTPDTIRKLLLFLSPEYRDQGIGSALLVESLRRYLDSRIPFYTAEVDVNNSRIVAWWRRHLVPYTADLIETHRAEKQLGR